MTIADAIQKLQRQETNATQLLHQSLDTANIHQSLNAFAFLATESAMQAAKTLDADTNSKNWRGPLHGIPISIKDLFNVATMPTHAGTKAKLPKEFLNPLRDAVAVRRLRQAGAVLIGKTNMHEIALGVSGENNFTGDVCNPHNPVLQAGGSSSGAAVAVAVGAGLAALGTDTGGSIRVPASFCGVVGYKPSFGLLPLAGALHLSWTCDHAGPLVRSVGDARIMTEVLAGKNLASPMIPDLRQMRFAVPRKWLEGRLSNQVRQAFEVLLNQLKDAGAKILDITPSDLNLAWDAYTPIVRSEAAYIHRETLANQPEDFGQNVLPALLAGRDISKEEYFEALLTRNRVQAGLTDALQKTDAIILPAAPTVAPARGSTEVLLESGMRSHREAVLGLTLPFSLAGLPTLSLPFVHNAGLPVGLQVVGAMHTDARVLAISECIEKMLSA